MKRMIVRLANHFSPSGRSGPLAAVTCSAGANVLSGLGQQFNHVIAGTISDCLGAQFVQSVPVLANMSTGGFNTGSMATELAVTLIGGALLAIFTSLVSSMRPKSAAPNSCVAAAERTERTVMQTSSLSKCVEAAILEQVFSDDELANRVRSLLRWKTLFNDVNIAVSSGHVTLSGQVISALDREIAEKTIRRLRGVVGVTNCIIASPTGPR